MHLHLTCNLLAFAGQLDACRPVEPCQGTVGRLCWKSRPCPDRQDQTCGGAQALPGTLQSRWTPLNATAVDIHQRPAQLMQQGGCTAQPDNFGESARPQHNVSALTHLAIGAVHKLVFLNQCLENLTSFWLSEKNINVICINVTTSLALLAAAERNWGC